MSLSLREEWLTKAMHLVIEKVFAPHNLRFPPIVKVCPAPLRWNVEKQAGVLGMCVYPDQAQDGCVHMFINTILGSDDSIRILATLVHELVHAHCMGEGHECKHGFPFSKIIRDVGLAGKPTHTFAEEGSELYATLSAIAVELGEYPHKPLLPKATKKRTSEVLSWVSETDPEYEVKCKFSLSQEKGAPRDYNGQPMQPKDMQKFQELEDRTVDEIEEEESPE